METYDGQDTHDEQGTPSTDEIGWVPQSVAMRRLGVSRTTLYRWRTELGLEAATVGRRLFYSPADIDALMRRSTSGAE